jgi:hypothetical protein
VPFEEDDRDQKIWFLDHSYLEAMYAMFKKVNGEHTHSHLVVARMVHSCLTIDVPFKGEK